MADRELVICNGPLPFLLPSKPRFNACRPSASRCAAAALSASNCNLVMRRAQMLDLA
jgi:hypothetical protein